MAEYITRNNAISAVCFGCNIEFSDEPCEPSACKIRQAIMDLPKADVEEVVRCKDCKYSKSEEVNGHTLWNCLCLGGLETIWADAFCAYAERTPQKEG